MRIQKLILGSKGLIDHSPASRGWLLNGGSTVVVLFCAGLADPQALNQAVAAYQACHFIGMPECDVSTHKVFPWLLQSQINCIYLFIYLFIFAKKKEYMTCAVGIQYDFSAWQIDLP